MHNFQAFLSNHSLEYFSIRKLKKNEERRRWPICSSSTGLVIMLTGWSPGTTSALPTAWFKEGPLQPKNFVVHHSRIFASMVLSNDESFVVTGGYYQGETSVLKLSIGQMLVKTTPDSEFFGTFWHFKYNFFSILRRALPYFIEKNSTK